MQVRRAALIAALALSTAACGSSGSATQAPTIGPGGGGTSQAPGATAAGGGGGGGGGGSVTGATIADGAFKSGKAHVEVTGDRTITLDMNGSGFAASGSGGFTYVDQATQLSVSVVISPQDSGLAIAGKDIITGGTWGKECDLKLSRNDGGGVTGEFSCPNVEAADPTLLKQLKVTIKGSFSAER